MRCLYCGKELALLKRWTRGGQFCSEAHQKSYQEEYNRIGLTRLLQAQNKNAQAKASSTPDKAPSSNPPIPEAPVAVEEAPYEDTRILEAAAKKQTSVEALQEALVQEQDGESVPAVVEEVVEEKPWEPVSLAGFVHPETVQVASIEASPRLETWEPAVLEPVAPEWQFSGELSQTLPEAAILKLKFRPNPADGEHSAPEVKMSPSEFVSVESPHPPELAAIRLSNGLPGAGVLKQNIVPSVCEWSPVICDNGVVGFPIETAYQESSLLELARTEIGFPGADADIFVEGGEADGALWTPAGHDQAAPEEAAADDAGEGSKLEVAEEPATEAVIAVAEPVAAAEAPQQLASERTEAPVVEERQDEPVVIEAIEAVAPDVAEPPGEREEQAAPRGGAEPIEIPAKVFAPQKPSPMEGEGALIKLPVFLPGLTGLPLRPKMGLIPASSAPASKKTRPGQPAIEAAEAKTESKAATETKPASETQTAGKRTTNPGVTAKPWGKPMPRTAAASKTAEPAAGGKTVKVTPPAKVQSAPAAKVTPPAVAKTREENKPAAEVSETSQTAEKKIPVAPKPTPDEAPAAGAVSQEIEAPSFGGAQMANTSWLGTLKGKLAIGGVAAVLCVGAYFVFGGKSQTPAAPATSTSAAADKAGPSIMVGGGGWVEGWAGDPAGAHVGRKITIYRPSLKLSDYRIEFKGEIEHKSLGWVFRAADPDNYYAMKLAIVTPGVEPKIALLKYLIANGRETQVGKTPVDLNVRLDTIYSVRVDVRGSQFTTYVQGQKVDTWSDSQLKSGGVGFLNEKEERGSIKTVSVSLLNGGK